MSVIHSDELRELHEIAANSPRLRKNLNIHTRLDAPVQRLFNAMEPGTYIRPHRHARENGWELMLVIQGSFAVLFFDDRGQVTEKYILSQHDGLLAVEVPASVWHTVVSLERGTVMFEVKEGPYTPVTDKDFADWAPQEGGPDASSMLEWFRQAQPFETAREQT